MWRRHLHLAPSRVHVRMDELGHVGREMDLWWGPGTHLAICALHDVDSATLGKTGNVGEIGIPPVLRLDKMQCDATTT
jgi:hypothetical protein